MKKIESSYTTEISGSYDIPVVALFVEKYKTFPSVCEMDYYFNMTKLLESVKQTYKINDEDIIASRIRDKYGSLRISEGVIFLKQNLALHIIVGSSQIEKQGREDDEDYPHIYPYSSPKEVKKSPEDFKATIAVLFDSTSITEKEVQSILEDLLKFKVEPKKKNQLKFLCKSDEGLHLKTLEIKKPLIDISLNYGSKFKELYDYICDHMIGEKNQNKGLILFFGAAGSGKTTIIKLLINELSDKKQIIYLPPDMAASLSDPNFLPFLMKHQNSILVIEDGENVIKSRKGGQNQAVSNLLNIADGLLSDALNIQIICTFNCELIDVDEALLRKGRLIAKHEFKALSKEDSQKLLDHLGLKFIATKDMTLAEIYNCLDQDFTEEKKIIGF